MWIYLCFTRQRSSYTMIRKEKIKYILRNITIEPVFFIFAMCFGFYIIASSQLYIDKVCKVNLNISEDICNNIQKHDEEQIRVQEYVSQLKVYNRIIQAIPPCIYALLAGPWSDRNGRKFLIVCSVFGYVLCNGVFLINTIWFYEFKAEFLMFECIQGNVW